jgi:sugar lactone lactonase YvrE
MSRYTPSALRCVAIQAALILVTHATLVQAQDTAPTITIHPIDQSIPAGQNVHFIVAATGAPAPTFLWQQSTNAGGSWSDLADGPSHSGTTTSTMTITSAFGGLSRTLYRAVATNVAGSATSDAATLIVTNQLTVTKNGNGAGTVTSDPAGIACGSTCAAGFDAASSVTLTATPTIGSVFTGWSFGCSGTGACTVPMLFAKAVTATFFTEGGVAPVITTQPEDQAVRPGQNAQFTVAVTGEPMPIYRWQRSTSSGGSWSDIVEEPPHSGTAAATLMVTSVSSNMSGHEYRVLAINGAGTATSAAVTLSATYGLTVTKGGTGNGSVASNPAGIECGNTCTADFNWGSSVALTATPATGSIFAGWSGAQENLAFGTLAGLAGSLGNVDGIGGAARFQFPRGITVDSAGNLYLADSSNHTIRKVTPAGVVTTLAGLAGAMGSTDGTGSAARFFFPSGVAVDSAGIVYVADANNHTVRKITPAGVVTTLAGLAGVPGSVDGAGSGARFQDPRGVTVDSAGNLYLADSLNHTVRKVTPLGVVTTLAGLAGVPGSNDGAGSGARFSFPDGITVDSVGNLYLVDTNNHTIRKVSQDGVVTTLAGLAFTFGSADGTGSAARFWSPSGVAIDSAGKVYVADTSNHTVRKGVGGACNGTGTCTVSMYDSEFGVTAMFTQRFTLTLTKAGTGGGIVVSEPAGIDCGSVCSESYDSGASVTLHATPAVGFAFSGWSGACTGSGPCTVLMTAAQNVTATFSQMFTLTVIRAGTGSGTVTADSGGINCGSACSAAYPAGISATLTATPASDSVFAGWSGACTGAAACVVPMVASGALTATFHAKPAAVDDGFTTEFNTQLLVSAPAVLANDSTNGSGALTAVLVGTATNGLLSLNGDGGFNYTPNSGFVGSDTFTYRAANSGGTSNTATVTITVNAPLTPQPPLDLYVSSVAGNNVTLRWKAPAVGPQPTGYEIEGGTLPGGVLATLTTGNSAPIYSFTAPTGVFYVRVHTVAGGDRSDASNEVRLVVNMPEAPSAPADLAAAGDGSSLGLSWRNTFDGGEATSFVLDVTGSATISLPLGLTESASFPVVPSGTYTLALRATNDTGSSATSNVITVTVPSVCSGAPPPPANFLAYKFGNTLALVWEPAASEVASTGYVVNVTGAFVLSIPTPNRSISGTVPPGVYGLSVQATNSCGASEATPMQVVSIP